MELFLILDKIFHSLNFHKTSSAATYMCNQNPIIHPTRKNDKYRYPVSPKYPAIFSTPHIIKPFHFSHAKPPIPSRTNPNHLISYEPPPPIVSIISLSIPSRSSYICHKQPHPPKYIYNHNSILSYIILYTFSSTTNLHHYSPPRYRKREKRDGESVKFRSLDWTLPKTPCKSAGPVMILLIYTYYWIQRGLSIYSTYLVTYDKHPASDI